MIPRHLNLLVHFAPNVSALAQRSLQLYFLYLSFMPENSRAKNPNCQSHVEIKEIPTDVIFGQLT